MRIGVREVWFWRDDKLQVFELVGETYERRDRSIALPELDLNFLLELLAVESFNEAAKRLQDALRR